MHKKKIVLVLILVFVLLLGGAYVLYDRLGETMQADQLAAQQPEETPEAEDSEPNRIKAPDFTVYDVEGNAVQLSDYVGKPVVLNFWASWCGYCVMEMPEFEEKYRELGDEVQFLMVNVTDGSRETVEIGASFIEEQGYAFPVVYDTDGQAVKAYGAYSLPTTVFIDAEGFGVAQATGAIGAETLQQGIDMITGK